MNIPLSYRTEEMGGKGGRRRKEGIKRDFRRERAELFLKKETREETSWREKERLREQMEVKRKKS